ncbi:hypothetical protein HDU96_003752 [Phlyctochytrium bullatum]|nr:hypothetical protein HDU96_003752 [Phlyctochytrium bullatum]
MTSFFNPFQDQDGPLHDLSMIELPLQSSVPSSRRCSQVGDILDLPQDVAAEYPKVLDLSRLHTHGVGTTLALGDAFHGSPPASAVSESSTTLPPLSAASSGPTSFASVASSPSLHSFSSPESSPSFQLAGFPDPSLATTLGTAPNMPLWDLDTLTSALLQPPTATTTVQDATPGSASPPAPASALSSPASTVCSSFAGIPTPRPRMPSAPRRLSGVGLHHRSSDPELARRRLSSMASQPISEVAGSPAPSLASGFSPPPSEAAWGAARRSRTRSRSSSFSQASAAGSPRAASSAAALAAGAVYHPLASAAPTPPVTVASHAIFDWGMPALDASLLLPPLFDGTAAAAPPAPDASSNLLANLGLLAGGGGSAATTTTDSALPDDLSAALGLIPGLDGDANGLGWMFGATTDPVLAPLLGKEPPTAVSTPTTFGIETSYETASSAFLAPTASFGALAPAAPAVQPALMGLDLAAAELFLASATVGATASGGAADVMNLVAAADAAASLADAAAAVSSSLKASYLAAAAAAAAAVSNHPIAGFVPGVSSSAYPAFVAASSACASNDLCASSLLDVVPAPAAAGACALGGGVAADVTMVDAPMAAAPAWPAAVAAAAEEAAAKERGLRRSAGSRRLGAAWKAGEERVVKDEEGAAAGTALGSATASPRELRKMASNTSVRSDATLVDAASADVDNAKHDGAAMVVDDGVTDWEEDGGEGSVCGEEHAHGECGKSGVARAPEKGAVEAAAAWGAAPVVVARVGVAAAQAVPAPKKRGRKPKAAEPVVVPKAPVSDDEGDEDGTDDDESSSDEEGGVRAAAAATHAVVAHNGDGEGNFACACGKLFRKLASLKSHNRQHRRERQFLCEVCERGFSRKHDLRRHLLTHSKENKVMCQVCETTFTRLDALQRHIKGKRCRGAPLP